MTKILVTGGAGYIGSVLVEKLVKNHEVIVVDNLSTGHEFLLHPGATFEHADLRDFHDIEKIFERHKPEVVMHLAAFSVVSESAEKEQIYRENNVQGTANLIQAMKSVGCDYLVFSSTAAVYGEPQEIPITEEHPCQPINVYGQTKLEAERLIQDSGLQSVILRYFNAAGASGCFGEFHEPETHLIPSVMQAVSEGKAFKLFGDQYATKDGTCVRDFVDVRDVAEAHSLAMNYLQGGGTPEIFNLGSGTGFSVKEIVDTCMSVLEKSVDVEIHPPRKGDPAVLIASNGKAVNMLRWKPKHGVGHMIHSAWNCM